MALGLDASSPPAFSGVDAGGAWESPPGLTPGLEPSLDAGPSGGFPAPDDPGLFEGEEGEEGDAESPPSPGWPLSAFPSGVSSEF
ncbi:MAG TPA: hypothetical protein PK360_17270 [bacterium]|nr:hypothetical protein [bacterium]